MRNEVESASGGESVETNETLTSPKQGFFADPKKAKTAFVVVLIFLIIFVLGAGTLGYLYWKKNQSLKTTNENNQRTVEQLNKDKADLERQVADTKKENEDLKKLNQETDATKANKEAVVKAYTEVLSYIASIIDKYQGFDNWTEADYQKGIEIAKKTQSTSFLATCQWAWTRKDISQMTRFVRFLNEVASGINDNLP